MRNYCLILTCFLSLSIVSVAFADVYKAPVDKSQWQVHASKLSCSLTHNIPGYGQAIFTQSGGKRLHFQLETTLGRLSATKARIYKAPAYWKTQQKKNREKLAEIKVDPSKTPIHLTKMTAYQLLYALAEGDEPQIVFMAANDTIPAKKGPTHSKEKDTVILSASAFQAPYQEYMTCVDNLVKYTFEEIRKSTFFFDSGSKALNQKTKAKLNAIAAYVMSDKNVYRIHITGHSDGKGGYMANRKLANERMWNVKDYLVFKGVKPDLFTLKGYGDRIPLGPNKTKEGRAKNRRVEIKVYR